VCARSRSAQPSRCTVDAGPLGLRSTGLRFFARELTAVACALTAQLACGAPGGPRHGASRPARESRCTLEDARTATPDAVSGSDPRGVAAAVAAEAARPLPRVVDSTVELRNAARHVWSPARFSDHVDLVNRLRSLRRLKLLPVWDDARVTVFFGLDRAGHAGLHFEQQERNEPLLFMPYVAPLDVPALRSRPLALP
jgi:hypothetical protein